MLVALRKLSRHKDVTCKTHFKILWFFLKWIFFFFKYNYIVHLLPFHVKAVQWVHWRGGFSLWKELLLSPSAGRLWHTPRVTVSTSNSTPSPREEQFPAPHSLTTTLCVPALAAPWGHGCHQGWQSHASPPTLKIHVMAQKLSFIHTTWISHRCAEWIWLQSGGSKFGLLHSLIEESWARDTEMRNWMSFIISFLSPCFSCCLSPLFAGILSSSSE